MRLSVLFVLFAACAGEVGPGDVGYLECYAIDLDEGCEPVDFCCKVVDDEGRSNCWYERSNGDRYHCLSEIDCGAAADEAVCDTCPGQDEDPDNLGCGVL